jgi:glutathione peroxidase
MDKPLSTIYDFEAKQIDGRLVQLSEYKGKVLLIVNTASGCGFTPQYEDLQRLYNEFSPYGFEVLAFPSNDFGRQEPLENSAIASFCTQNYQVTFPIFEKTMVRGDLAHPLFKFLADKKLNGKLSATPRWNFHKYLINKQGEVVEYYYPFTKPTSGKIRKKIVRHLRDQTVTSDK